MLPLWHDCIFCNFELPYVMSPSWLAESMISHLTSLKVKDATLIFKIVLAKPKMEYIKFTSLSPMQIFLAKTLNKASYDVQMHKCVLV